MINDSGIFLLKNKEPFDRQEIFRVLEEQYKGLSLASYKLKMQCLLESGKIARVGRNLYCIPDNQAPVYDYEYSELAVIIQKLIYERHPFLEYRIFELVQMNEFLNHQIAHNAVFVFVEADLGDFVFETLKEKFPGKILLNPSVKEYHLYWQDDLIIIGKLLTEAPKGKKAVWHTCLEKMLVDMTAEKVIKTTFSEAEYPGVLEQAFQKYIIELHDELKSKLRDKSGRYAYAIGLMTVSISIIIFSILGQLEIIDNSRLMVLYLGGYLLFQIVIGIVIFKQLLKKYE